MLEGCEDNVTEQEREAVLRAAAHREVIRQRLLERMSGLFSVVEADDRLVVRVEMGVNDYALLRKYCRRDMDVETDAANLKAGLMAHIWNVPIWLKRPKDLRIAVFPGRETVPKGTLPLGYMDEQQRQETIERPDFGW